MDLQVVWENFPRMLDGAVLTLEITAFSVAIGLAVSIPLSPASALTGPIEHALP